MTTVTDSGPDRIPRGVGLALGSAVLFGASAPAAKALLDGGSPQLLAGLLYVGSGIGLAAFTGLWSGTRRGTEAPLTRRDLPWIAGAILFGGIIAPVLLLIGLSRTPASSASLLLNLEGVFTALLAWMVFRENVDRRIAAGMLAIVLGGLVLSWQGRVSWGGFGGPLAIVAACASWGIDNNLTQKVSGGDPARIAMLKGLVAGVVNAVLALFLGAPWPKLSNLSLALLLGFLSYGVSLVLFIRALRHLGTARTGAYFSMAPFVGVGLSLLVWREHPELLFWVGMAFMALGLWLHITERHEHNHVHEELPHDHAHVHDDHHRHSHSPSDPPGEPHSHLHRHPRMIHSHPHYPDLHHRHEHA